MYQTYHQIHSWSGTSKQLNTSKYVKCLALVHGRLYSGCQDNSIQEIDLATGTLSSIQSGSRKLIGKSTPVHALKVHDGLVYSAGSSIEGTVLKVWNASNYNLVQSVSLASEVRTMVISSDMIYMGCKGGTVEVWCRKKLTRKETLQTGTNCRVICMALDSNEDFLVVGTSDGRIQIKPVAINTSMENNSPLFDDLLDDLAPMVPVCERSSVSYMGITWLMEFTGVASFVKSFTVATDPKHTYFKQRQESARKDVERAFGVLQGRSDYTLRSIQEDGQCRNVIAETAELCFSFRGIATLIALETSSAIESLSSFTVVLYCTWEMLPIMADKYEYERRKKEKLEEVKARLDFGEARRKSTKAQESAYSECRTMSPKRQTKARRESTVFKRLGSKGRSASAHSDSRQESSVYRGLTLKSEDSEGDTGNLNPKDRSRVEDEISPTWVCAETDPFTSRIRHFDFPKTRMPSHVKTYNGSEDPEDHLKIFQAATKTERWAMPGPPLTMMSHMFNSTLTGNARVWFDDLPPESIDSYNDLREERKPS
ncbi:putative E3 ubiquitin-protein ligase LIN [Tanacetum coccineum]|uniref:E3 ubiquitin-protein ligase LIN n=1 Tax=Tanacetum coccineum TaxID=301880 RepID=A0ABQ5IJT0_9ASTR